MTITQMAQLTSLTSLTILFILQLWLVVDIKRFYTSGRVATLWTCVYFFFLMFIFALSFFKIGTLQQRQLISGFAALFPTIGVTIHLILNKPPGLKDHIFKADGFDDEDKILSKGVTDERIKTK